MLNRFSPWFAVLPVIAIAACDASDHPLLEPGTSSPAIQDARDARFAGSGVYLLPPISDNQFTRTGPFDIQADPRVEICRLDVAGELTVASIEAASCAELVAWFETDVSYDGSTFVKVTPGPGQPATTDSLFSVNWNTSATDAGSAFRGSILVPTMVLDGGTPTVQYDTAAQFDALLYANSSNQLDPDYVIGTTAGQNFPLKFIVEENAGCDGLDCFAYRVTCEAGVFQTEHAGVLLPEDWATECDTSVPGPEHNWLLFQQRQSAGSPCIPSELFDGIQYEPCYVWQLVEEIDDGNATQFRFYDEEFALPATVQFCYNPEADGGVPEPLIPLSAVYRFSQRPDEVALTPEAEESALTDYVCPYDGPQETTGNAALAALTQLVRPALRFLGLEPRPLFAGDEGTLSTKTIRMSHFQDVVAFDDFGLVGEEPGPLLVGESQDITIRLTTPPHHDPLDGPSAGVPGEDIQFEVLSGDAELSGGSACTAGDTQCTIVATSLDVTSTPEDEGGYATAVLTIGSTGGTVELRISVPGDPDFEALTLTLETVELDVVFLEPLDTGDFYGSPDERFEPTVYICAEGATPCTASTAAAVIPTSAIKLVEENGRKFYQADWKPRDTNTPIGGTYFVQVLIHGATVGYSIPVVTTKGGKGERVGDVYYDGINASLNMKFTITPVVTATGS